MNRSPAWTIRLLTLATASLLALAAGLAADFTVSLFWRPSSAEIAKPYVSRAHDWYELQPNFVGFDEFGPLIYPVETDAHGFRKAPGTAAAGPGDVIFLGDSFTYGINAAWENTFVGMYSASTSHRVLNAGVASYSPTAYLHQYERALAEGVLRAGHIVVIAPDISDVQDEAGIWTDGVPHPRRLSAAATSPGASPSNPSDRVDLRERLSDAFPNTSAIYRVLRHRVLDRHWITEMPRSAFTFADWSDLDRKPATSGFAGFAPLGVKGGLERVEQKLLAIMQAARHHDAHVYILTYPWPAQLAHADRFSWSAFLAGICARGGCAGVVDTIPVFRDIAASDQQWRNTHYVSGDTHFTRLGNRIIADALLKSVPHP